jgi:thioredoxin reductase (NADPH)
MNTASKMIDAVILGAGPAGVSCAVWLARLGFAPLVVEATDSVGGLCRKNPYPDNWNASLPGVAGVQVADQLARSLDQANVPVVFYRRVDAVAQEGAHFLIQGSEPGEAMRAANLVLATGVRPRRLAGPNVEGILTGPGHHILDQDFIGKRVAVLGGGDNAFENALYAQEQGATEVHLFARNVRAQRQFVRRFASAHVHQGTYTVDPVHRAVNGHPYDLLLVFYGWEPCTDFAESLALQRSVSGFIATDMLTAQTSVPGVYAIGEVAQRQHPCVVTALADGVTAAKAIQAKIESLA